MRKGLFHLCVSLCVVLSPSIGFATSQSARDVVLYHFAGEEPSARLRATIASNYVRALRAKLQEHSIVVLDPERFVQELPSDFGAAQAQEYRDALTRLCVDTLSERDAKTVVSVIQKGGFFARDVPKSQKERYVDSFNCFSLKGSRWLEALERVWTEWPEPFKKDLVRILTMPGIAQFPNRIVKQNVIRSLQ